MTHFRVLDNFSGCITAAPLIARNSALRSSRFRDFPRDCRSTIAIQIHSINQAAPLNGQLHRDLSQSRRLQKAERTARLSCFRISRLLIQFDGLTFAVARTRRSTRDRRFRTPRPAGLKVQSGGLCNPCARVPIGVKSQSTRPFCCTEPRWTESSPSRAEATRTKP
jgi:hypothetical protein